VDPAVTAQQPETSQPETQQPESTQPETQPCPSCGAPTHAGDQYCEECGADLTPGQAPAAGGSVAALETEDLASSRTTLIAPPGSDRSAGSEPPTEALPTLVCPQCGGRFAEDGYCEQCGNPAPRERDRWTETPASWVAGVCDKGLRHQANEDAMALAADPGPGGFAALVVCDGVSTALSSDVASLAAARAARDVLAVDRPDLADPGQGGQADPERTGADRAEAWLQRMSLAGRAANRAAAQTPPVGPGPEPGAYSPPSCTFVAVVLDGDQATVGGVGDSRAYWLPDDGTAEQLSVDDSWATVAIEHGMSREEAESAPHAHAITRWLGSDTPDAEPRTRQLTLDRPGWLLVCSDGLWNYCSEADALGRLMAETITSVGSAPADLAAELVAWSNRQGGVDNITVTLARFDGGPGRAERQTTGTGASGPEHV